MRLTPTLRSVEALHRKLERELYRAYHARNRLHKADHFYNFCITAHSMRDYWFERQGLILPSQQQPLHSVWGSEPVLMAVADIANSSKHFVLRERHGARVIRAPTTRRVRQVRRTFGAVYRDRDGNLTVLPERAADLTVILSDGTRHDLYSFMSAVVKYWRTYLSSNGVKLRKQAFRQLAGS